jgi:hypothetical protein
VAFVAAVAAMLTAPAASLADGGGCTYPPIVHPFTPWGDTSSYVLAAGGSFEPKSAWNTSGGAKTIMDNEPWHVNGAADAFALSLNSGSSGTSGATCAPQIAPIVRFFAKNVGASTGVLHVELIANSKYTIDLGNVVVGSAWQVTERLVLTPPMQTTSSVQLQVRLTPVGTGAAFVVDDVYIDPYDSV